MAAATQALLAAATTGEPLAPAAGASSVSRGQPSGQTVAPRTFEFGNPSPSPGGGAATGGSTSSTGGGLATSSLGVNVSTVSSRASYGASDSGGSGLAGGGGGRPTSFKSTRLAPSPGTGTGGGGGGSATASAVTYTRGRVQVSVPQPPRSSPSPQRGSAASASSPGGFGTDEALLSVLPASPAALADGMPSSPGGGAEATADAIMLAAVRGAASATAPFAASTSTTATTTASAVSPQGKAGSTGQSRSPGGPRSPAQLGRTSAGASRPGSAGRAGSEKGRYDDIADVVTPRSEHSVTVESYMETYQRLVPSVNAASGASLPQSPPVGVLGGKRRSAADNPPLRKSSSAAPSVAGGAPGSASATSGASFGGSRPSSSQSRRSRASARPGGTRSRSASASGAAAVPVEPVGVGWYLPQAKLTGASFSDAMRVGELSGALPLRPRTTGGVGLRLASTMPPAGPRGSRQRQAQAGHVGQAQSGSQVLVVHDDDGGAGGGSDSGSGSAVRVPSKRPSTAGSVGAQKRASRALLGLPVYQPHQESAATTAANGKKHVASARGGARVRGESGGGAVLTAAGVVRGAAIADAAAAGRLAGAPGRRPRTSGGRIRVTTSTPISTGAGDTSTSTAPPAALASSIAAGAVADPLVGPAAAALRRPRTSSGPPSALLAQGKPPFPAHLKRPATSGGRPATGGGKGSVVLDAAAYPLAVATSAPFSPNFVFRDMTDLARTADAVYNGSSSTTAEAGGRGDGGRGGDGSGNDDARNGVVADNDSDGGNGYDGAFGSTAGAMKRPRTGQSLGVAAAALAATGGASVLSSASAATADLSKRTGVGNTLDRNGAKRFRSRGVHLDIMLSETLPLTRAESPSPAHDSDGDEGSDDGGGGGYSGRPGSGTGSRPNSRARSRRGKAHRVPRDEHAVEEEEQRTAAAFTVLDTLASYVDDDVAAYIKALTEALRRCVYSRCVRLPGQSVASAVLGGEAVLATPHYGPTEEEARAEAAAVERASAVTELWGRGIVADQVTEQQLEADAAGVAPPAGGAAGGGGSGGGSVGRRRPGSASSRPGSASSSRHSVYSAGAQLLTGRSGHSEVDLHLHPMTQKVVGSYRTFALSKPPPQGGADPRRYIMHEDGAGDHVLTARRRATEEAVGYNMARKVKSGQAPAASLGASWGGGRGEPPPEVRARQGLDVTGGLPDGSAGGEHVSFRGALRAYQRDEENWLSERQALEARLREAEARNVDLVARKESIEASMAETRARHDTLRAAHGEAQGDLAHMRVEQGRQGLGFEQLESAAQALRVEASEHDHENAKLSKQIQALQSSLAVKRSDCRRITAEITELQLRTDQAMGVHVAPIKLKMPALLRKVATEIGLDITAEEAGDVVDSAEDVRVASRALLM